MRINAKITRIVGDVKLKAYATLCFDDKFLITGVKVIDGTHGRFVSMPGRKARDGTFYDVGFPITKEFRQEIQDAVLEAYTKKMEEL